MAAAPAAWASARPPRRSPRRRGPAARRPAQKSARAARGRSTPARASPHAPREDSLWVVSSDVVFLVDFLTVPLQPHRQMAGRFQLGVNLERLVGAGHLQAVDRRDDVAVLQAD